MKNLIRSVATIVLALYLTSCEKEEIFNGATQSFSLQSDENGATYHIKVALPANYNPANQKYATIYVLDGEENFDLVSRKCEQISSSNAVSNVLVVSIGYGLDRSIDYTPATDGSQTGAHQFLDFIETQLIPKMEQDFGAAVSRESRVILGHSYGGLLGAYAFCTRNELFGNYILLSPSLWYDHLAVLKLEKNNRDSNKLRQQLVFMGIGETENYGKMQAPFEAFYSSLVNHYPNIRMGKNRESDLDHMGSKNPNIKKALAFYFHNRS